MLSAHTWADNATPTNHDMHNMPDTENASTAQNVIELKLTPNGALQADHTTTITATLINTKTGKALTADDLDTVHTQKFHLLVIDPTLTDYQHLHPTVSKPGEWVFDFTPRQNGMYRLWANITPTSTHKGEFISADLGLQNKMMPVIDKKTNLVSQVGDYTFTLALEGEPKAGSAMMASIRVTKDGKPFAQLQPVMGAFAHVVGFNEDYKTVLHIHPLGKEPDSANERGGPELSFHIEFTKTGFVKLFAQFNIDGKDIFAPFGITIK